MPRSDDRKRYSWYDVDTGQEVRVVEDNSVARRAPKQKTGGNWMRVYTDEFHRIDGLSALELRVLLRLMAQSSQNGPFGYNVGVIAAELSSTSQSVSRALRTLRSQRVLIDLGHTVGLIDPRLMWRGGDSEREEWLTKLGRQGLLTTDQTEPTREEDR